MDFKPKYDEGYGVGYPLGYSSGLVTGKERGWQEGTATGKTEGFSTGWTLHMNRHSIWDTTLDFRSVTGRAGKMESATVSSRDLIMPTIAAQFFEGWNGGSGGSFGSLGFAITGSNHIGFYGSSSSGVLAVTLLGSYDSGAALLPGWLHRRTHDRPDRRFRSGIRPDLSHRVCQRVQDCFSRWRRRRDARRDARRPQTGLHRRQNRGIRQRLRRRFLCRHRLSSLRRFHRADLRVPIRAAQQCVDVADAIGTARTGADELCHAVDCACLRTFASYAAGIVRA